LSGIQIKVRQSSARDRDARHGMSPSAFRDSSSSPQTERPPRSTRTAAEAAARAQASLRADAHRPNGQRRKASSGWVKTAQGTVPGTPRIEPGKRLTRRHASMAARGAAEKPSRTSGAYPPHEAGFAGTPDAAHLLRGIPRKRGPPSKLLRSSLRVCRIRSLRCSSPPSTWTTWPPNAIAPVSGRTP